MAMLGNSPLLFGSRCDGHLHSVYVFTIHFRFQRIFYTFCTYIDTHLPVLQDLFFSHALTHYTPTHPLSSQGRRFMLCIHLYSLPGLLLRVVAHVLTLILTTWLRTQLVSTHIHLPPQIGIQYTCSHTLTICLKIQVVFITWTHP